MRILFVGDSMTIGSAGEHTWRYRMWQHLNRTYGGPYRIVGPRRELYDQAAGAAVSHAYADPGFPERARGHLAGWGEGWLHMAPLIREEVRRHRVDVALVSLGLIDLGFYTDAGQTVLNARSFVAEARAANPALHLALMPVVPNIRAEHDAAFAAECSRFNALLAEAVAELGTADAPLLLLSPPDGWETHRHTYDGTHPNALGEHALAGAFADALHKEWEVGAPYEAAAEPWAAVPG
ncbi:MULTISPECIES: GDSL-type esterase/lipase family protein [unclassified Streptomyces]|uniref:GDSL-type esterase/lipase family protein n=1 Tax=unclassified Streptomyces TaxID=2593676 RepID=UPI000BF8EEB1|nr:GDSL-type esterase/lipase family protein [Streptomyces sp. Ru87]PGH48987.1 hypothetical protein CRI70_20110 [Streptomyces sp. Ru87]